MHVCVCVRQREMDRICVFLAVCRHLVFTLILHCVCSQMQFPLKTFLLRCFLSWQEKQRSKKEHQWKDWFINVSVSRSTSGLTERRYRSSYYSHLCFENVHYLHMWVKAVLPKLKKKLKKHKENNPDLWTLKLMSLLCKSDLTNTVRLFVVCVYIVFSDVLIFGTCADEIWCLHVVGYTYVTSSVCPCWQQLADSSRLHRPCILFLPVMSWPSSLQRAIRTNETSVRRSALSSDQVSKGEGEGESKRNGK